MLKLEKDGPIETTDPDPFGVRSLSEGISRFLRNGETRPPLTIGIEGDPGAARSALLAFLRDDLRSRGVPVVWFDAWQHESEEDLFAVLLQRLAESVPRWWQPSGIVFRGRLLAIRAARRPHLLAAMAAAVALVSGYLAANPAASLAASVRGLIPSGAWLYETSQTAWIWLIAASPVLALFIALADLLWKGGTLSGQIGRAELHGKRDFHARVAEELRNIGRAFAPRVLTVLVDDLDRCRPQALVRILEAVQFVVSSGECFAVIGLARAAVERSLRVHFSTIGVEDADGVPGTLAAESESNRGSPSLSARYLNRLIGVEIALPSQPTSRLVLTMSSGHDTRWRRTATLLALIGGAAVAGVGLGYRLPLTTDTAPAFFAAGVGVSWLAAGWFLCLAGAGVFAIAYMVAHALERAMRRPRLEDSGELRAAFEVWFPVIGGLDMGPRALKRFLNEVRMLSSVAGSGEMPESVIVALLALRRSAPSLLERDDLQCMPAADGPHPTDADVGALVENASKAHHARFGSWPPPAAQVARFRGLLREIGMA